MTLIIDTFPSGWVLTLTHLAAATAGYFMCHWLTMRAGRAYFDGESEKPVVKTDRKGITPAITLILVAALVLIGIGVQSALSQRASNAHDDCVTRWGDELISTVETRGGATAQVETAQTKRDDALDALLVGAIGNQDIPEKQREKLLKPTVDAYVKAVQDLHDARSDAATTRAQNPFPELNC